MIRMLIALAMRSMLLFARVTGPLLSISARGSIAKTLTFSVWKGIAYCKEWFTPANPQSATQTNMRKALTLAVAYWGTMGQSTKDAYDVGAEGTGKSGFNLYMQRALDQYIIQLGTSTDPLSVSVVGDYPSDVYTWLPVV